MNNKKNFFEIFQTVTNLRKVQSRKTLDLIDKDITSVSKDQYLQNHPKHFFHIVDPSPWALLYSYCSIILLPYQEQLRCMLFFSRTLWFFNLWFIIFVIYIILLLFRDIIFEGTVEGCHY
jgi:hypothetical protein